MKNEIKTYMDLDVWKKSHELTIEIYKITKDFPNYEFFGLVAQLRRAASSIPANIAEGNGRHHLKEYIQSLYISRGSLNEARYFILLSKDLKYISEKVYNDLNILLDRIVMMLMGLIRSLKRRQSKSKKDPS